MKVVKSVKGIRETVTLFKERGLTVGLVPTMGALHRGHLELVRRAKKECDRVVVSIFVNPLQFGPKEDFRRYPRTFEEDLKKLKALGADIVFCPSVNEIYPGGANGLRTAVSVSGITEKLCGRSRPGHFTGVATVVAKLFNIIRPDKAYFGKKDYQQLAVVRRMSEDLNFDIKIAAVETVREKDGLALSSRNRYLTPGERIKAPGLRNIIIETVGLIKKNPADVRRIKALALKKLGKYFSPDYFEIVDSEDFGEIRPTTKSILIAAAVYLGKTRLIDNEKISC